MPEQVPKTPHKDKNDQALLNSVTQLYDVTASLSCCSHDCFAGSLPPHFESVRLEVNTSAPPCSVTAGWMSFYDKQ